MDRLITITQLITKARESGFNFGSGDPVNLIHHYSRLGFLPRAVRLKPEGVTGHTVGCYPQECVGLLLETQKWRQEGLNVDEVKLRLGSGVSVPVRAASLVEDKPLVHLESSGQTDLGLRLKDQILKRRDLVKIRSFLGGRVVLAAGVLVIVLAAAVGTIWGAGSLVKKHSFPKNAFFMAPGGEGSVLAAQVASGSAYLEINPDVVFNGKLSFNTPVSVDGREITLDQNLSKASSPTFADLTLASGTIVLASKTQTLTNKTIDGGSNTLSNIANSSLANSKVTVTAGTNLTGGGDVSLGSSVTLTLSTTPSVSTLTTSGLATLNSATISGNLGVVGLATVSGMLSTGGNLMPLASGVQNIGSSSLVWNNIYANNLISGSSGTSGYWQRNSGALSPTNITDDVVLGATATSSAKIVLSGTSGNVGIGSTSPAYKVDVVGTVQITGTGFTGLRMPTGATASYLLTTDGSGNASWTNPSGLTSFGAWTLSGSTIYPNQTTYQLLLGSTTVTDNVGRLTVIGGQAGKAAAAINETGNQAIFTASSAGVSKFVINNSGQVGVGTGANNNILLADVDIRSLTSNAFTASISASSGKATLTVDNTVGDLFTASSSGLNRFVIAQNGNVGIGTTVPNNLIQVANLINFNNSTLLTALGYQAGAGTGQNNTAVGYNALFSGTNGSRNTAIGSQALYTNTTGLNNSATGYEALYSNLGGQHNTANGTFALFSNSGGYYNTAVGEDALYSTNNDANTAFGYWALYYNTTGTNNVAVGYQAGGAYGNGAYSNDVLIGANTSYNAGSIPTNSTEVGYQAGYNTGGAGNTLLGYQAGYSLTSGGYNIAIGQNVTLPSNTGSQQLNIGNVIYGTGIYGGGSVSSTPVAGGAVGVGVTSPLATLDVRKLLSGTSPVASISGATSMASLVVDNSGTGDIFTASSSGLNRFVITQNGNVGIGIASPLTLLDVRGAASMSGALTLMTIPTLGTTSMQTLTLGGANTGSVYLSPKSTTGLFVDGAGNVGIGTTGPDAKLRVSGGNITLDNNNYIAAAVGGSPTVLRNILGADGTNDVVLAPGAWNNTKIYANGSEVIRVASSGNVGIGTTGPVGLLHVQGACVTDETLLKKRRRRKNKKGQWVDEWIDTPIKDIKVDDEVLTLDEKTGEFIVSKVENLMDMGRQEVFEIVTETGKSIKTTERHPYLVNLANDEMETNTNFLYYDLFEKAQDSARQFYQSVLEGKSVKVPAMHNEAVIFGHEGWNHLMQEKRSRFELLTRFFALPKILAVLELAKKAKKETGKINKDITFWTLQGIIDGVWVRVIIRSVKGGPKYFYSVVWKGEEYRSEVKAAIKKGAVSRLYPRRQASGKTLAFSTDFFKELSLSPMLSHLGRPRRMVTSQLFNKLTIPEGNRNVKWVKVKDLKVGAKIATEDGWERIIAIKDQGKQHTFDVQIANTHNFVANGIVAHNTTGKALVNLNTTGDQAVFTASVSGVTKFIINNSGNVGIGTSAPGAILDLVGSQNFSAFTAPGALTAGTPTSGGSCTAGTHSYAVTFTSVGGGETTAGTVSNIITCVLTSGQTAPLSAIPTGPAGTISRKVYRTVAGNTGSYLLLTTIADNTTTTFSDTVADASLGAAAPASNTTAVANLQTGGTTRMTIDNLGNVGIGTTGPGTNLDVIGSIYASGLTGANRQVLQLYTDATGAQVISTYTGSSSFLPLQFKVGGSERVRIDTAGNVGIGTTGPRNLFEINQSTDTVPGTMATYGIMVSDQTTQKLGLGGDGNYAYIQSWGSRPLQINNQGNNVILNATSGNVGIGTTSPTALLQVFGNSTTQVASISASTGKAALLVDNTIGDLFTASSSGLSHFVITQGGNIGIGSTAPVAIVDITSSLTGTNYLNITSAGSSIFSVSDTAITNNLPTSFTAAGDVAIAYDINFTNPVSSYIKSAAPLYLQSGETFNSSDLTLRTFNKGNIIFDANEASVFNKSATISGQLFINGASLTGPSAGTLPAATISAQTSFAALVVDNKGVGDIFTASSSGLNRFVITQNGNVGVGTSVPRTALDVVLSSTATSSAFIENSNTASGIAGLTIKLDSTTLNSTSHFVNFLDLNGKNIGSIQANGTTGITYATQGIADFAEWMKISTKNPAFAGDLGAQISEPSTSTSGSTCTEPDLSSSGSVASNSGLVNIVGCGPEGNRTLGTELDRSIPHQAGPTPQEIIAKFFAPGTIVCQGNDGIFPCTASDSAKIIGVVSAHPSFLGGVETVDSVKVGFIGQIPIKVFKKGNTFSEGVSLINPGDSITIDPNNPGYGIKATTRGYIVGKALGMVDPVTNTVLAFVKESWYEGSSPSVWDLQDHPLQSVQGEPLNVDLATISGELTVLGNTQLANTSIGGNLQIGMLHIDDLKAEISSLNGEIGISGNLNLKSGHVIGNESMRGELILEAGQIATVSAQGWAIAPKSVVVTPTFNTNVWVESLGTSGFTVKVGVVPMAEQKIYWQAMW